MNLQLDKFEDWLRAKNLKERTIEEYLYYFGKFSKYIVFNQDSVSKFLSEQSNRNNVARSFLLNLQRFLKINYKEMGLTAEQKLDIAEVELPKITGRTEEKMIKPLTEQEILRLEQYCETDKDKLQLLFTFYCGLRHEEMLRIKIVSFNWDEWKKDPTKHGICTVFGKGSKQRPAYVPPEIMKKIARYIKAHNFSSLSSYLFLNPKDNNKLDKINLKNREKNFQRSLKKAGIKSGLIQFNEHNEIIPETDIWPHRLRHSYEYYLRTVKGIEDMNKRRILMRHSSIISTQRYSYADQEEIKRDLEK